MIVGVLINSFAATQDVAVDGMAIDLTPVNEQGKLNAFMSFGKAIGWSVTAAVSGMMLVTVGMKATAITASVPPRQASPNSRRMRRIKPIMVCLMPW